MPTDPKTPRHRSMRLLAGLAIAIVALAAVGLAVDLSTRGGDPESSIKAQGDMTGIDFRLMRDYRVDGRRVGIVANDWLYCYPPTGEVILVPRGYMTDFASIPDIASGLIDRFGDNAEAAVAHDWLYAVGQPGQRELADDLFRYALKEQGVGLITRNIMHRAVRTGGGKAYGSAKEWNRRFGNPVTGKPLPASPFNRPATGFVTKLASCDGMESLTELDRLRTTFGSEAWPRVTPP